MKKMSLVALTAAILALGACGSNSPSSAKESATASASIAQTYTITFDFNYEGSGSQSKTFDVGTAATPLDKPTREGYDFIGWFLDKSGETAADFSSIQSDTTVYASWEANAFNVTFDENFEGGKTFVVAVKRNQTVAEPTEPTREGYSFLGWHTEKEATNLFDFATPITAARTLYAGWEADAGDTVKVTFNLNYEGASEPYLVRTVKIGRRIAAPQAPTREGYMFRGWFLEAAGDTAYDFSKEVSAAFTLYAKWLTNNVFEAELTPLEDKVGNAYSSECAGLNLINYDTDGKVEASNGAYVANLYMPNLTLDFAITSSKEVTDAILTLRLSVEYYDMSFSPDNFRVDVNKESTPYSAIDLTGAIAVNEELEKGKRPFTDHLISTSVHLKEGENLIQLVVANDTDLGGTMAAEAPMVDCLYLATDATLTWEPQTDNILI